jgi:hypothetical protein
MITLNKTRQGRNAALPYRLFFVVVVDLQEFLDALVF